MGIALKGPGTELMARRAVEDEEVRWQHWMSLSLQGDANAYRSLLAELYDVVYGYVRRIVGDSALVEDCVQECLETLHRNRQSYDPNRPFRPWFFTLVRHKAIDFLRMDRSRSHVRLPTTLVEPTELPKTDASLDAGILLAQLEPMYRQAIVLTKLKGYTAAEAATLIGVSSVAMRSRVHRALRQLESLLELEIMA